MSGRLIYLDHNATTPVDERVFEVMSRYLTRTWGNPSSGHPIGWDAAEAVLEARGKVAGLIGCSPSEIVFTSGGTESNNLAILGSTAGHAPGHIVTTSVEHPATTAPLAHLERMGWRVTRAAVDDECVARTDEISRLVGDDTFLFTVMHSNNETGVLQPVAEISRLARTAGAIVHVDAAQSVGKVPIDVKELGVHLLSIAGHKLYAPKGVGALYVRDGVKLSPVLLGAGQEGGVRPGTENVAGIAGLGEACAIAGEGLNRESARISALRDLLQDRLVSGSGGISVNGHLKDRLPNTLNVRFDGIKGSLLLARCDEIAASTGAACHAGGVETPSAVLTAMGIDHEAALGAVRLSLGRATTESEVERAAAVLLREYGKLRGRTAP